MQPPTSLASMLATHRAQLLDEQAPSAGYHTWRAMHRAALLALTSRAVILAASQRSFYPSLFHLRLGDVEPVNDWYGRGTGDAWLTRAATVLRESLPEGAVATRVGGIDFAVLVFAHGDHHSVQTLAEELLQAVAGPHLVNGRQLTIGVRIGVAHGRPGVPVHELLAAAELAAAEVATTTVPVTPESPGPTGQKIIQQRRGVDPVRVEPVQH